MSRDTRSSRICQERLQLPLNSIIGMRFSNMWCKAVTSIWLYINKPVCTQTGRKANVLFVGTNSHFIPRLLLKTLIPALYEKSNKEELRFSSSSNNIHHLPVSRRSILVFLQFSLHLSLFLCWDKKNTVTRPKNTRIPAKRVKSLLWKFICARRNFEA